MWQLINLFPKCKREYINITVKEYLIFFKYILKLFNRNV